MKIKSRLEMCKNIGETVKIIKDLSTEEIAEFINEYRDSRDFQVRTLLGALRVELRERS